ncbi:hypothetical protein 7S2_1 [uncultured Caudovirales phage]|uniref:HNH nuclease domain-containing protein n=1 Tax=uncultured Caudovirales phage TaxID=2100421 RepID=A0A2H4J9P9_9CAUD|nr:hypothetical protein 7S2_1 [uncultured Caudovirales phage]
MGTIQRNTTTRDRHRKYIARTKPPCGICGQDIDYGLPYLDPMSYVVDHTIPLARGGTDDVNNKQAAHRDCNQLKAANLPDNHTAPDTPRSFITARTW